MSTRRTFAVAGVRVPLGATRDIHLKVSESYTGEPVNLPIRVIRAKRAGPTVFVSAAIHGDELNGTGIIRELMFGQPLHLTHGSLICIPVVNLPGFERHERYLPDRRDLNRSFPGSPRGSLASRIADVFFNAIVPISDYGIDLHSAAVHRTNFPNVRGDLRIAEVRRIAEAFGCELVVRGRGPDGSFRRAACEAGCPTIILEAGEVAKIEPTVLEIGVRGVHNVLKTLGMMAGEPMRPVYQAIINKTVWVRAEFGGLLRFHVAPGEPVDADQPIATNESIFGEAHAVLLSPSDGIVLGMTTYPASQPGEPVCHIAVPGKKLRTIRRALRDSHSHALPSRLRQDLATNITVNDMRATS